MIMNFQHMFLFHQSLIPIPLRPISLIAVKHYDQLLPIPRFKLMHSYCALPASSQFHNITSLLFDYYWVFFRRYSLWHTRYFNEQVGVLFLWKKTVVIEWKQIWLAHARPVRRIRSCENEETRVTIWSVGELELDTALSVSQLPMQCFNLYDSFLIRIVITATHTSITVLSRSF